MFVDEAGWGWPKEPAPKAKLTKRGERAVLWLILANALLLLIAPIGGGTIIEPIVGLFSFLR
jgi:hypothetical protein